MFETRQSRLRFVRWVKVVGIVAGVLIAPVLTFGFNALSSGASPVLWVITLFAWIGSAMCTGYYVIVGIFTLVDDVIPRWVNSGATVKTKSRKQRKAERNAAHAAAKRAAAEAEVKRIAELERLANIDRNNEPIKLHPHEVTKPVGVAYEQPPEPKKSVA